MLNKARDIAAALMARWSSSPSRQILSLILASLILSFATYAPVSSASSLRGPEPLSQPADKEWPVVGGDWNNTRYSILDQINVRNISKLGVAWTSAKFDEGGTSRVTPIVHNGMLLVTAGRKVYALNAKTGARLWSYTTNTDPSSLPAGVPNNRGVGVGGGLVFVGLKDGQVIALDIKTGALRWARQTGARESRNGQYTGVAPTYHDGRVLTALANGDAYLRGRLTDLDARTGKELWTFYAVPAPGDPGHETWPGSTQVWESGGGGIWSTPAVDPELGLVYAATGNAVPMYGGDLRPGDNLYTCSIVAVDMTTGKIRWYYQLVHHDVFDADISAPPILFDSQVGDKRTKALAILRSDGYLFELDRETGVPILPIQERPVPQLASQRTAATQPFPVGGDSVLMSCDEWKKEPIPSGFALGCMWTAPASAADQPNVLAPFPGARALPMAYSPITGYFYAQGTSVLTWPRRAPDPFFVDFSTALPGLKAYKHLVALDSRSGKVVWRVPVPASVDHALPWHLTAGPIVTAGGLVFQSLGDGNVAAFDAATGKLLWRLQTDMPGVSGAPVSYEMDGEQYLAVPIRATVWAFKLGGKIPARAQPLLAPGKEETAAAIDTAPAVETSKIETTALATASEGPGARYFIDEEAFHPYRARVKAGAQVLFVNNGDKPHEAVALDGSWGTGLLRPTQVAYVSFNEPGRYTYICKNHPWAHAEIIVVAPDGSAASVPSASNAKDGKGDTTSFAEQARLGKEEFDRYCSTCHGQDLTGRTTAPPLAGSEFTLHWRHAAVADLFDRVRTTMPQSSPGSLDTRTYLNIVAYLLRANDLISSPMALKESPEALRRMGLGEGASADLSLAPKRAE
jgi:quinohemoprotein ethanol dehydrogenase